MPDTNRGWEGDLNEAVVEEWIDETTPFERVREVLLSTTEPQYAKELAERARVSEPTARKHLRILATAGVAETVETGRGMRYKRSRQTVVLRRISEIHADLSREELADGIRNLREQIRGYQDEYDATDPDDLSLRLEADDGDRWTAVAEWRALERDLQVAQAALALYDFDPNGDDGDGEATDEGRGAFARGTDAEATG
jgi:DNA-binding transcriptional ArsR family regulator